MRFKCIQNSLGQEKAPNSAQSRHLHYPCHSVELWHRIKSQVQQQGPWHQAFRQQRYEAQGRLLITPPQAAEGCSGWQRASSSLTLHLQITGGGGSGAAYLNTYSPLTPDKKTVYEGDARFPNSCRAQRCRFYMKRPSRTSCTEMFILSAELLIAKFEQGRECLEGSWHRRLMDLFQP